MGAVRNKRFIIENRIEELTSLAQQIDNMAEEWKISPTIAININLVIEEAVSNIIFYAYTDSDMHKIEISVSLENNKITIGIMDDGKPFNPLEQQTPDINLTLDERPVGGLGIFLISKLMDDLHYERIGNKNILTLYKIL